MGSLPFKIVTGSAEKVLTGAGACPLNGRYSGGSETGSPYYAQSTSYAGDATVSRGSTTITAAGSFQDNYSGAPALPAAGWIIAAYDPASGEEVSGIFPAGEKIASCASKASCTLTMPATADVSSGHEDGQPIEIEAGPPGGCGMYDLMGSSAGKDTGSPSRPYFDNCNWWVQDLTVSHNSFSVNANPSKTWKAGSVTNCLAATGCGYMVLSPMLALALPAAFGHPTPTALKPISSAQEPLTMCGLITTIPGQGLAHGVSKPGETGDVLSQSAWRGSPYNQDSGSAFRT